MPERNFKIGVLTQSVFIALAMVLFFVNDSYGRGALKLYSITNNSLWNSSASWSLTSNGLPAGFVPQNNDTVVISCTIIQNENISFTGGGSLMILDNGFLRGDNLTIDFSDNASLNCKGKIKTDNISFVENAACIIENSGKLDVSGIYTNNSVFQHIISGKLLVGGSLNVGSLSAMSGNGEIESSHFYGNGKIMGFSSISLIPDGSSITENNWLGISGNNWNDPENWSEGVVPSSNSNISVLSSAHNPEIYGKVIVADLFINQGSSVTVYPSAVLEVIGNMAVKATGKLLLKSTVTEKASLIVNGDVTGKIQAEYPVVAGKKDLISSPVGLAQSGTFLNMYLRSYNESSSQWGEYIVPTTDPLQVMHGYELFSLYSETKIFEGTPEHSAKSFSITNSGNGLNLSGNPFPCYIDWENNENDAWQRSNIASAIYYPDPSGSGNYSVYLPGGDDAVSINSGSRYIAPMQGFFVKASNEGSLTVTENSRVSVMSDSKLILKNNSIKFKLTNSDGLTDEAMFRVIANATFEFDDELDALKIHGNSDSPSININSDGETKYAINTIPTVNSSLNIPLNIESSKAGMYSIACIGSFNFEYRYPVFLEDKELNKFIDLRSDSAYSFYHTPEMNSGRFVIHFDSPKGIDEQQEFVNEVVALPGEVRIKGNDNDIYTASLFTVDGKLISTAKGKLSEGISLPTGNLSLGIGILRVFNGKQTSTKKIVIK